MQYVYIGMLNPVISPYRLRSSIILWYFVRLSACPENKHIDLKWTTLIGKCQMI